MNQLYGTRRFAITLGDQVANSYLALAKKENKSLREWSLGAESTIEYTADRYAYKIIDAGTNKHWNKRSTFRRGIIVPASVEITGVKSLVLFLGTKTFEITCRAGRIMADNLGVYLDAYGAKYHPTASELKNIAVNGWATVIKKLRDTASAQKAASVAIKQTAREFKLFCFRLTSAEKKGLRVTLADSRAARNCEAGSKTWCEKNKIDWRQPQKPSKLIKFVEKEPRVLAALNFAAARFLRSFLRSTTDVS